MAAITLEKKPSVPEVAAPVVTSARRPYTKPEETEKYIRLAEKHPAFVLKENNPKDTIFVLMSVVPMVTGLSLDRGEKRDRFYVATQVKDDKGKYVNVEDSSGAFYCDCEDFLRDYKRAD